MKSEARNSRRTWSQVEVAGEIRRQIESRVLQAGDRLLSYNEMRERYGIHSVAVQRVYEQLAGEGLIVRELGRGTFVAGEKENLTLTSEKSHRPAREVSPEKRNGIIGLSGLGFTFNDYSPYWVKVLRGIRAACDESETQILLLDHKSNKGWEKADGVLICDWSNSMTLQWLPPHMPCVSVLVPAENITSVYADDHGAARAATEYLLKLGHRRIASVCSGDAFVSGRRSAGIHEALRNAGITPRRSWERTLGPGSYDFGDRFVTHGRAAMENWISDGWAKTGCTAILAQNDETALGIIEALRQAKIRVPQDVSVMGFDGAIRQEYSGTSLTTMEVPLEKIGHTATSLLLRKLRGEEIEEQHRVFPIALRAGKSTTRVKAHATA